MQVDVFIDSTVVWSGNGLNERSLSDLKTMRDAGQIQVHVPEIVVLEIARHAQEMESRYAKECERFRSLLRSMGEPPEPMLFPERSLTAKVRSALADLGSIDPIPAITHLEVLARDLANRRPFQSNGRGYRDALIWETLLENSQTGIVVLLSNNSGDFGAGKPHADLISDLSEGPFVVVLGDVPALRKWLMHSHGDFPEPSLKWFVEPPLSVEAIGAAVGSWPLVAAPDVRFGRRVIEAAEVEAVSVVGVREVVEFEEDDGYGGFEAQVEVEAEVSSEVSRSQLGQLDPDVRILEVDAGQEQVSVTAVRPLVLKVVVSYRLDTREIDHARVEEAWSA